MRQRSWIAIRICICLTAALVLGVAGGTAAAGSSLTGADAPPAASLAAVDKTTEDLEDETDGIENETDGTNSTNETSETLENATDDETTGATGETTNETVETTSSTDGTLENATAETNETTGDLEDATDETVTATGETTDDGTTTIEESTATVDDATTDDATDGAGQIDETTDAVDESTETTNSTTATAGSRPGDASPTDGSSDANDTGRSGDASDDESAGDDTGGEGGGGSDARSTAADAVLVGLLGAVAAAGGPTVGASGAGAASGTTAGWAGSSPLLRLLRRAGSVLPREILPIFRYSRYDDSDPLENDARRAIYETVRDEPGCYLSRIGERSDRSLSTVRHHLRVLEEEGLVTTAKVNGKRRCYPAAADGEPSAGPRGDAAADVELRAALAEPARRDVLEALADLGRAHNGRLADELDRDPSTVSHHLAALEADGLVVREKEGRSTVNELASRAERALRDASATEQSAPRASDGD